MLPQGQVKIIGNYQYNLKHCLGEGAYGKVYQGVDTTNNQKVAIKKLDLKNFEKDTYLRNQIISEIEILKKFNHKNIVKFIDLISTQRSLYIITEFCKDGDLREIMARKRIPEPDAWKILKQIVQGFRELVQNAIIHRDMKPANVLSHEGVFKIADFGFAKYVDNFSGQLLRSCVGSPLYMAPQILARKPYSTKCDIWSLGIIFYEMIFQDVPWKGRDERDLLKNILSVPLAWKRTSGAISPKSEEFLRKSLTIEESERMSWDRVFELFEIAASPTNDQKVAFYNNYQSNPQPQIQPQSQPQPNPPSSSQQRENQRKKSIFTNQQPPQPTLASLKQQYQEIVFRNFVLCTDLHAKYNQLKNQCNSSILEKLMLTISKTTITMQSALINLAANFTAQQPNIIYDLKKDLDYYTSFHSDLIDLLQRNGQLVHCERDLDLVGIRDQFQPLSDSDQDKALNLINQLIRSVCQECLDHCRRNGLINRPNMLSLDNLLDVVLVHKKVQRGIDIDYDQMNADKAEEEDGKRIMEKVVEKLKLI